MRSARLFLPSLALLVLSLLPLREAAAAGPPGRMELRLSSPLGGFGGIGSSNGVALINPERGGMQTNFGLGFALGFLTSRHLEPGFALNVGVLNNFLGGRGTLTTVAMTPFLKINTWLARHANLFIEPYAGFMVVSYGGSSTYFDGGMNVGIEALISSWGIRFWTGIEATVGNSTYWFTIPIGWGLIGYF